MDANAIDWRALLIHEVGCDPRGKAGVALRLGVSRAYVSRVLTQGACAIEAVSPRFIERVLDAYHVIECPATLDMQPRSHCHKANTPAPMHNPLSLRIWRTCQNCQHKPRKP